MRTIYNITFLLILFKFTSCDVINPSEEIPSYIYVSAFQLNANANQGTNSNKITDVWVTVGNDFLGVYPLPALIPTLAQGEQTITLEAGIKNNGINANSAAYPFYQSVQSKVTLQSNEIDTLRPIISYRSDAKFPLNESFESSNHAFRDVRAGNDFNRIQLASQGAFEGSSAQIMVDKTNPLAEIATVNRYPNPTSKGTTVYLEVNYKSEAATLFGIIGYKNGVADAPAYRAGFVEKSDWNKIYFNLSELLAGTTYDEFQVVFQMVLPSQNNIYTKDKATIWLDNIKLVHF